MQTKVSELEEQGAEFDLTPMVPADQMAAFQHAGFWRSVLPRYKEGSKSDYTDYSHLPSVMLVWFIITMSATAGRSRLTDVCASWHAHLANAHLAELLHSDDHTYIPSQW